jgi:hypothetical protein
MLDNTHVMLDFETIGNTTRSGIIAIGAVKFDPENDKDTLELIQAPLMERTFYRVVDGQSSLDVGMEQTASTMEWWAKQSEEARAIFKSDQKIHVKKALEEFSAWLGGSGYKLWGNGANFDNPILSYGYEACGLPCPIAYWDNLCYRTVKTMFEMKFGRFKPQHIGVAHNALADAVTQTVALQYMWSKLFPKVKHF